MTSAKIAVVGAGAVGSTLAYACLVRGVATTVALHDVDAAKVRAEELDVAASTTLAGLRASADRIRAAARDLGF